MTRRERWGFTWFVLVCCIITGTINWAIGQSQTEPQAQVQVHSRVPLRGDFDLIEFPNGSQWYLKRGSIQAIWGVPPQDQERLGFATRVHGAGYEVSFPYQITEVLTQIYLASLQETKTVLEMLKDEQNNSD